MSAAGSLFYCFVSFGGAFLASFFLKRYNLNTLTGAKTYKSLRCWGSAISVNLSRCWETFLDIGGVPSNPGKLQMTLEHQILIKMSRCWVSAILVNHRSAGSLRLNHVPATSQRVKNATIQKPFQETHLKEFFFYFFFQNILQILPNTFYACC